MAAPLRGALRAATRAVSQPPSANRAHTPARPEASSPQRRPPPSPAEASAAATNSEGTTTHEAARSTGTSASAAASAHHARVQRSRRGSARSRRSARGIVAGRLLAAATVPSASSTSVSPSPSGSPITTAAPISAIAITARAAHAGVSAPPKRLGSRGRIGGGTLTGAGHAGAPAAEAAKPGTGPRCGAAPPAPALRGASPPAPASRDAASPGSLACGPRSAPRRPSPGRSGRAPHDSLMRPECVSGVCGRSGGRVRVLCSAFF